MKLAQASLAVLAAIAVTTPVMAEELELYGRANVGVVMADTDANGSETSIENFASRFGVKGDSKIDDALSAFYTFEWEVNVTDNSASNGSKDNLKARNQFVGLKGSFGKIAIGRSDTQFKMAQGGVDLFNDYTGDIKQLFAGENRLGDSIIYQSPEFNGFTFGATYITEDNDKQTDAGFSLMAGYGDAKLKKTSYYVSVAYDDQIAGYTSTRVTAQGKLGEATVGAMYQTSEKDSDGTDGNGFMVSVAYPFADNTSAMVQYQDSDMTFASAKDSGTMTSVGVEHKLSKKTRLFGFYTMQSLDTAGDNNYLGFTIRHDF